MAAYRALTLAGVTTRDAADLTGVARATAGRPEARPASTTSRPSPRTAPANRLSVAERVEVLAVLNKERAKGASDIPTVSEAGFPKLGFDGLVGIFGPRKMPDELREKIAADVKEIVTDPDIAAKLTATGQNVSGGTPAEFAAAQKEQAAQVDAVAKLLGLKRAQ